MRLAESPTIVLPDRSAVNNELSLPSEASASARGCQSRNLLFHHPAWIEMAKAAI
jgi:hypothetical protein